MARFHRLQVWLLADEILRLTYRTVKTLRGEADLRDQMKRSAISVVSNIAEGSERGSDAEFRQFLIIARGSAAELHAQWHIALTCDLVDGECAGMALNLLDRCGRMLTAFIARLSPPGG
jgi:four helix bundle protein